MIWSVLALLSALLSMGLAFPILRHAYRRSLGTGVMVTFIPGYFLMYAFGQFEHPRRHWLLPALLGLLVMTGVFAGVAATGLPPRPTQELN
jgi:4-hydroxybenzoate polyprenyltransferase